MDRTTQRRVVVVNPQTMGRRGFGHVYLRGRIFWIKYVKNHRTIRESSDSDRRSVAEDLLKRRLAEKVIAETRGLTCGELLDDALSYYRLHNSKSYKDFAKPFIDGQRGLREYFGDFKVSEVTTVQLVRFQEKQQAFGLSNATINRKMALMRKAFKLAARQTPPKVAFIPWCKDLPENGPRQGFLTHDKYLELRAALPEDLRLLYMAAYYTGCRCGELLKIRPEQVDLPNTQIVLRHGETKNEEARTLPLYGELLQETRKHMTELSERWPNCRFLFHRAGKPIKDFRDAWQKACAEVGLPGLLFHDLRRSAVRNMRRAGISEPVAMRISGHKTREVFQRYDITDNEDLKQAGSKLVRYFKRSRHSKATKKGRK